MIGEYLAFVLSAGLVFFLFWDCLQACIQIRSTPIPPDSFSAVMDRIYSTPTPIRQQDDDYDDDMLELIRQSEAEMEELERLAIPEEERPEPWTIVELDDSSSLKEQRARIARLASMYQLQITNPK